VCRPGGYFMLLAKAGRSHKCQFCLLVRLVCRPDFDTVAEPGVLCAGRACAVSWRRAAAVGAAVALAVATRPDGEHFVRFVREYTQRGLGFIPGAVHSVLSPMSFYPQ